MIIRLETLFGCESLDFSGGKPTFDYTQGHEIHFCMRCLVHGWHFGHGYCIGSTRIYDREQGSPE